MELNSYTLVAADCYGRELMRATIRAFTTTQAYSLFWAMVTSSALDMVCGSTEIV